MTATPAGLSHAPRRGRRVLRVALVGLAILLLALAAGYQIYPLRGASDAGHQLPLDTRLTREQALTDVDYAYASLRDRHLSTVDGVPPALRQRYDEVRAGVPAEPTVLDVWRAVSRLANAVGDGHTRAWSDGVRETEASFRFDGTRLTLAEPGGPEVRALNGVPVAALWREYQRLGSFERPDAAVASFADDLRSVDRLRWLGGPASDTVVATLASGPRDLPTVENPAARTPAPPTVTFTGDTAVLRLDECEPGPAYTSALDTLFAGVRQRGLSRVVVDLRANGGGASAVANEFIRRLDADSYRAGGEHQRWGPFVFGPDSITLTNERVTDPYRGRIWVLTSNQTFSAAVMFAWMLRDNDLATVVGQPPANNPTSYGDVIRLRLPESGLRWNTTYKLFTRANGDTDPAKPLLPDIVTKPGEELAAVARPVNARLPGRSRGGPR